MSNSNFINKIFSDSKLSPTTVLIRSIYLGKKLGLTENNYFDKLSNIDVINDPKLSEASRITYLFHVISFLRAYKPKSESEVAKNKDLLKRYVKAVDALKLSQAKKNKTPSSRVIDDHISLTKLQTKLNSKMINIDEYLAHPAATRESSPNFLKRFENFLLMSMYVNMPAVRNDFTTVKIVNKKDDLGANSNYIVVTPRTVYLYLTQYKTSARYGRVRLEIGPINTKLVRELIRLRKELTDSSTTGATYVSPWLFTHVTKRGSEKMASDQAMIQRIRNVSAEYFTHKQTINSFRHAWETHIQHMPEYADMSVDEREQLHNKLLHSMNAAAFYNVPL